MANHFCDQKANRVAVPQVKNPTWYGNGRVRNKVCKFGTTDAAQNDIIFTDSLRLDDVVYAVEFYAGTALGASVTGDLGPYLPQTLEATTAVLSPISGGTAAEDRFCSAIDLSAVKPLNAPAQLWGESGTPASPMPMWEALGYSDLATALVAIPGGLVDLGLKLEGANPASSDITIRIVYNSGD